MTGPGTKQQDQSLIVAIFPDADDLVRSRVPSPGPHSIPIQIDV